MQSRIVDARIVQFVTKNSKQILFFQFFIDTTLKYEIGAFVFIIIVKRFIKYYS